MLELPVIATQIQILYYVIFRIIYRDYEFFNCSEYLHTGEWYQEFSPALFRQRQCYQAPLLFRCRGR